MAKNIGSGKITRKQFIRSAGAGAAAVGAAAVGGARAASAAPPEAWAPDFVIEGKNDPLLDALSVQEAVGNPSNGKILLRGTFNFGDGAGHPRQTVIIRRGVELRGEVSRDHSGKITAWLTQIVGGGAVMPFSYQGVTYSAPGGAFKLESADSMPVVFNSIHFRKFSATGILASGCNGLEIRGCKFNEADAGYDFGGSPDPSLSDLVIITPVFGLGPGCRGAFVAEDNVCINEDSFQNDDNQFIACEYTSFTQVRCTRNDIYGQDEGIAIMFNGWYAGPGFSSVMSITDNKIKINWRPTRFKGANNIGVLNNLNATIDISGNTIETLGYCLAIGVTGENVTVRNNRITLSPNAYGSPVAAVMLGDNELFPAGIPPLGPCNNSVVSNNIISGTALWAFFTYDVNDWTPGLNLPPDTSSGNVVMGNNTDNLACIISTVWLSPGSHDNVFKGGFGSVVDFGTDNYITGYSPKSVGIGPEVSEKMRNFRAWRGHLNLR